MAGLVKAKKYDWKDSNLSLFGSDLERNVSGSLLRGVAQVDIDIVSTLHSSTGEESGCGDGGRLERSR